MAMLPSFGIMESHPPSGVMQAIVKSSAEPQLKLTTTKHTFRRNATCNADGKGAKTA